MSLEIFSLKIVNKYTVELWNKLSLAIQDNVQIVKNLKDIVIIKSFLIV